MDFCEFATFCALEPTRKWPVLVMNSIVFYEFYGVKDEKIANFRAVITLCEKVQFYLAP